ncbi:Aste57867_3188 [Aphanomyces stellatus]|uniref:Aste57867_3188 protein n=1 Tax=Aphanomyces stellatus TaxID=120398 RepID=A0A485KBM3_9STRA|nr:hypothetical protein As57867_003179 [Aphanomyces stellatus]VFT80362.1 Aste57867_3188 [Aphanomyces stellatus]
MQLSSIFFLAAFAHKTTAKRNPLPIPARTQPRLPTPTSVLCAQPVLNMLAFGDDVLIIQTNPSHPFGPCEQACKAMPTCVGYVVDRRPTNMTCHIKAQLQNHTAMAGLDAVDCAHIHDTDDDDDDDVDGEEDETDSETDIPAPTMKREHRGPTAPVHLDD